MVDSEIETLSELYRNLETILNAAQAANGDYLHALQMVADAERSVAALAQEFHARLSTDPQISDLAALRSHLSRMIGLLESRGEELRQMQHNVRQQLAELNTGGRFLQTVQGYRENQPRFIDKRQ